MRNLAFWMAGTVAAFLVTAGAFLLLATLGAGLRTDTPEINLVPDPQDRQPPLRLTADEKSLRGIERAPEQNITFEVSNTGNEPLHDLSLTLTTTAENTAAAEARHYRESLDELDPGNTTRVSFDADLSRQPEEEPGREIFEVRATTPEGISSAITVVLSLTRSQAPTL